MNRAIKFRGKRRDYDVWVYGDLEYNVKADLARIHTYKKDGHYDRYYIVKSETVGQFTGLHDSNGTEIYEGDILMGGAAGYLEVFWSDDKAAFLAEDYNDFKQTTGNLDYLSVYDVTYFTLCGNVHDNKDLLKN